MLSSVVLPVLFAAGSALAATTTCSLTSKCPQDLPCCSQFGECGVGAYCLGGCDPRMSYSLNACAPEPVCQSSTTTFTDLNSIVSIDDFLGNPEDGTWVGQGDIKQYQSSALLTMPAQSGGSLMSSSTYMWYGNVRARLRTSRDQGVITAFILFSDVKDEIDYEFVGSELTTAQTNYYFQGIDNYTNSANISLSNTFENFHDYEIRWTPDDIQWLVDGQVGRTMNRSGTWNETSQQWMFPQTPARVQFSIWPGGLASNPQGTIDWAGGVINWDSQDIQKYGYYYAMLEEVTIECYNASSPPGTNDKKSYTYDSAVGTNNTVVDGNENTVLGSLQDSGLDMNAGASGTATGSSASSTAPSIPYGNGATGNTHSGQSGSDSSSGSSSSSSSSGSSSGSSSSSSDSDCAADSFHASCSSSSSSNGKSAAAQNKASGLMVVTAVLAMSWLQ